MMTVEEFVQKFPDHPAVQKTILTAASKLDFDGIASLYIDNSISTLIVQDLLMRFPHKCAIEVIPHPKNRSTKSAFLILPTIPDDGASYMRYKTCYAQSDDLHPVPEYVPLFWWGRADKQAYLAFMDEEKNERTEQ